jgi:phage tail-like protein
VPNNIVGQPVKYYQAWDFVVEVENIPIGGFNACDGLEREIKTATQMEGGIISPVDISTTTVTFKPITLKRGGSNNRDLYEWSLAPEKGIQDKRNVSIVQQFGGVPVVRWNCEQAVLTSYKGPSFDRSKEEENIIEEVVIQPLRWTRVDL